MGKLSRLLLFLGLLFICADLKAQTWSLVQLKEFDSTGAGTGGSACTGMGSAVCTVNVSAVGAGHALVCFSLISSTASTTLSGCGGGETWAACSTSCNSFNAVTGNGDIRYTLSAVGGETSLTCTVAVAPQNNYSLCGAAEFSLTSGSGAYDTSGTMSDATCTSCAGVGLTLSGSNDVILQIAAPGNSFSAVSSPYSTNSAFPSGVGIGVAVGISSGTAPTWTQSPTGIATGSALALKVAASGCTAPPTLTLLGVSQCHG